MELGKLADLDHVTEQLLQDERTIEESSLRIDQIIAAPPRYGRFATTLCYALAAAAGARLFGGGLREVAAAGLVSLLLGLLVASAENLRLTRVIEPLAGFIASFAAVAIARRVAPLSVGVTTLAALFVLLPGLTLTIALTEVASRHLISGTARLMGATLTFLSLAFGVALGGRLATLIFPGEPFTYVPHDAPEWTQLVALVGSTLAMVVLFRARRRDLGWVLLAGALAYLGTRVGRVYVGPELAAFAGAVVLGTSSNIVSIVGNRPAVVSIVPGMMLLVPGSLGFRSLESLLAQDVMAGVATAFSMFLVAVAIVAGLLLANALVLPRKAL